MNTVKRFLAAALATVIVFAALPIITFAEGNASQTSPESRPASRSTSPSALTAVRDTLLLNQAWSGGAVGATTLSADETITVTGNVSLTGTITVSGDISITGGGTLLRGANNAMINVTGTGSLTLEDITIDGNGTGAYRGRIISVDGSLTMEDGASLQNNVTNSSGGVYVGANGIFEMNGGEIKNNSASSASASGAVYNMGAFTMNGGKIIGNKSNTNSNMYGAGVTNHGNFTMFGGEISGNELTGTGGSGGGVNNQNVFSMYGGVITGNYARYDGGVRNLRSSMEIGGDAQITGNTNALGDSNTTFYAGDGFISVNRDSFPPDGMSVGITRDAPVSPSHHGVFIDGGALESDMRYFFADNGDSYEIIIPEDGRLAVAPIRPIRAELTDAGGGALTVTPGKPTVAGFAYRLYTAQTGGSLLQTYNITAPSANPLKMAWVYPLTQSAWICYVNGEGSESLRIECAKYISSAAVLVDAPLTGKTPDTSASVSAPADFTVGTVTWSPSVSGGFLVNGKYAATVTLTANTGCKFEQPPVFSGTVNVFAATATVSPDGKSATLTYEFALTDVSCFTDLEVITPPELSYTENEAADFSETVVRLTYADGSKTAHIPFADFGKYGITLSLPDETVLDSASEYDGRTVTVSLGSSPGAPSADAGELTVVPNLTGTAVIDNMNPKVGDTLTGSLEDGNNTGELRYVWKADGEQVGTNAAYTVRPEDLGKKITLEISSSVEAGTVSGGETAAVTAQTVAPEKPEPPAMPELESKTYDSVTLVPHPGYEYSVDGVNWQSDNTFTGLTPGKAYDFVQRIATGSGTEASDASPALTVATPGRDDNEDEDGEDDNDNEDEDEGDEDDGDEDDDDDEDIPPVIPPEKPEKPAAPELQDKTYDSVTLVPHPGYEYSVDGVNWQTDNTFTGLTLGKAYDFVQRIAGTPDTDASEASPALTVVTPRTNAGNSGESDESDDSDDGDSNDSGGGNRGGDRIFPSRKKKITVFVSVNPVVLFENEFLEAIISEGFLPESVGSIEIIYVPAPVPVGIIPVPGNCLIPVFVRR